MKRKQVFDATSAITWALISLSDEVEILTADVRDGRTTIHIIKPGANRDEQLDAMKKLAWSNGQTLEVDPGYFEMGDKASYTVNGVEVFMIMDK